MLILHLVGVVFFLVSFSACRVADFGACLSSCCNCVSPTHRVVVSGLFRVFCDSFAPFLAFSVCLWSLCAVLRLRHQNKKNGNKSKRSVQKLKETQNKILWNNWRCYKGKRNARQQSWELQRRSGIYFWTHITYELVHNLSSCGAGGGKCLRSDVSRVWNYRFNYMVWTESRLDTTVITLILLLQPQSI